MFRGSHSVDSSPLENVCSASYDIQPWSVLTYWLSHSINGKIQRTILRYIQNLPPIIALTAVYGLLGVRPIEQELDLRKLTALLGNILSQKSTLEYEIAQRQMAVKDFDSNRWVSDCRCLLHKYDLPNIYILDTQIESSERWRGQLKRHIDSFIKNEWRETDKSSLRFLNAKTLSVGKVPQMAISPKWYAGSQASIPQN